ncbi:MAG: polysaccharide biosynthesis PFTS motif protein, partial [Thermodesulfobacteriota bacterium]
MKSPIAENVFRISLCNCLAEFYSLNILIHRVEGSLGPGQIIVYPDMNVRSYLFIKRLLSRCNQGFFEHPNVRFHALAYIAGFIENLKQKLIPITRLAAQTIGSGLLSGRRSSSGEKKKTYTYGVTIVGPRQLIGNQRGANFIIDDHKIRPQEVVYFPLTSLTKEQGKILTQMPGAIFYPAKTGRFFSHFKEWKRLLWLALKEKFLSNAEEVNAACHAFLNYFRWLKVMEVVTIKHFITHCDFGMSPVGRNLVLHKSGVQTWYFTDSANSGSMWKEETSSNGVRHPFWTYLDYDHFVTWNELLAQYYKDHPGSFEQIHVVGCLWSEHIRNKEQAKVQTSESLLRDLGNSFILAAFDSTYSRNGVTSYDEGLVFAKHLLQLADDYPGLHIFLKEKKDRSIHCILDPILGPKLLDLYNKIDAHPRIKICSNQMDASELVSVSDMVVSFPFTSTTF